MKNVIFLLHLLSLALVECTATAKVQPKIYVYHLSDNKYHDFLKYGMEYEGFYGLDMLFPDLLKNSPYITTNASEADYFYVDVWMYFPRQDLHAIIKELQSQGPYWDRKRGADHIFVVTADPGRCEYPHPVTWASIYLHHFGRLQWLEHSRCDLFEKWGGECDWDLTAAKAALSGDMPYGCHIPKQDIVVPPNPYEWENCTCRAGLHKTPYLNPEMRLPRTNLLYYSGQIDLHEQEAYAKTQPWSDAGYSFGARQTVYRAHHHRPGFKIMTQHAKGTYWHDLSTSVFCLAAAGYGWGGRMKVAVTRGCIPVIIQDGIKVEWEEQLPMYEYGLRIPMWQLHRLPEILEVLIRKGRVEQMQQALECVWRFHWWSRPHGRAFELLMCELRRRLLSTGGRVELDTKTCSLKCGDDRVVSMQQPHGV